MASFTSNIFPTYFPKYKDIESTLQNTLVIAQKTADEIQNVAKQQAEQIIKDAEYQAKVRTEELNNQVIMKEREIDELKKQFSVYRAKMESLLISQLELIKDSFIKTNFNLIMYNITVQ